MGPAEGAIAPIAPAWLRPAHVIIFFDIEKNEYIFLIFYSSSRYNLYSCILFFSFVKITHPDIASYEVSTCHGELLGPERRSRPPPARPFSLTRPRRAGSSR